MQKTLKPPHFYLFMLKNDMTDKNVIFYIKKEPFTNPFFTDKNGICIVKNNQQKRENKKTSKLTELSK